MNQKIKVLFDTNILVYAHDEIITHYNTLTELLKFALDNQIQGVLVEQNIIELYRLSLIHI